MTLLRALLVFTLIGLTGLPNFSAAEPQTVSRPAPVPLRRHRQMKQIVAFAFDIDDNLFVTGARIYMWNEKEKKEVEFTTAEWAVLARQVESHGGRLGDLVLRQDAYRDFEDNAARLAKQFRQAKPGVSFDAYNDAIGHSATRNHVYLITARHSSPQSLLGELEKKVGTGVLAGVPELKNIYAVGWGGLPSKFRGKTTAETKANIMTDILDDIEAHPVPSNASWVTSRDGDGLEKLHMFGFSDDDFGNFSKAAEALSKHVSEGRWRHVKITLFFTGEHPTERKRAVVIQSDGSLRDVQEQEATRMDLPRKAGTAAGCGVVRKIRR